MSETPTKYRVRDLSIKQKIEEILKTNPRADPDRIAKLNGYTRSQRFLSPRAAHCNDCLRWAAMNKRPIGILPQPTERCACGKNCKCRIEYFK